MKKLKGKTLSKNMEKKEGIISFIRQLFGNTQNEEESIEQIDEIDEETRKELEKSYKHIGKMMEKYKIENFEVSQKEKAPRIKKSSLENKENHPQINQTPKKEMEQEQDGDERE